MSDKARGNPESRHPGLRGAASGVDAQVVERIAQILHDEDCPCPDQGGRGEHWRDYCDTAGIVLSALPEQEGERRRCASEVRLGCACKRCCAEVEAELKGLRSRSQEGEALVEQLIVAAEGTELEGDDQFEQAKAWLATQVAPATDTGEDAR